MKWSLASTLGARHGARCLLCQFLTQFAFVSEYRPRAVWHPQPNCPQVTPDISQGSSGDAGEDTKCRPLFREETFYNCIFGVRTTVLSCNANGGVSSTHSCPVVTDCLDQRAVPSCLKALLD